MLEASRSCEQFKMSRKVPGLQAQRSRFDMDWVAVKGLNTGSRNCVANHWIKKFRRWIKKLETTGLRNWNHWIKKLVSGAFNAGGAVRLTVALCLVGLPSFFKPTPLPSGKFRRCRTSIFGFYWTWNFQKNTGLRNCLGNRRLQASRCSTAFQIPRGRGVQNYQLPACAVLKQVLLCGPSNRQQPDVGPKILPNVLGAWVPVQQRAKLPSG